jgi:hypothetical protein
MSNKYYVVQFFGWPGPKIFEYVGNTAQDSKPTEYALLTNILVN